MMEFAPKPTIDDLRREADALEASVKEDNDIRDHFPSGRWPMIHRLRAMISEAAASGA